MKIQEKIKIAFIIDQLAIGGTENQLLSVIELLDRKKFDPVLICLRDSEYYKNLNITYQSYVLGLYSLLSIKGILKFLQLISILRREKINIVQTFFIDSNLIGILAAELAKVQVIIGTRRDLGYWYTPSLLKKIKFVNRFADRFLVNSIAIKETVSQYEAVALDKIDVIYNGIDLKPFEKKYNIKRLKDKLGIPQSDYVVGIVANLNREVKRVDLFVKAAAIVLKKISNCTFIVIGEGHLKEGLVQLAVDLGIKSKVLFLGSKKNIYPYLTVFDIGVLTSDSEGFSNSILEYMAAGLPVVCSDAGGNKEVIKDGINGFLCPLNNSMTVAESIIKLVAMDSLYKSIKENNIKSILRYSFSSIIKELNIYYFNLVN